MSMETVRLRPKEKRLINGLSVEMRVVDGFESDPFINDTAHHEACHILAAFLMGVTVHGATDKPGEGYSGATFLGSFNAIVAAAAEAMGCDGTGHDLWQIEAMGENPKTAVSSARSLLSERIQELLAIATILRKRRNISGEEAREAKDKAGEEPLLEITVTNPKTGAQRKERRGANDNEPIVIPQEEILEAA